MCEPPLLVIMARAPVCGSVKTRLAKEIGEVRAVALYRTLTATLLGNVCRDPRFRTVLAISPDHAVRARFTAWANGRTIPILPRIRQGGGNVGERMQRIFARCGRGPLVIVGTDIPFVTAAMIVDAFRKLASADAVFGPAEDGGYWLIGLRRRPSIPKPFKQVRWSSAHALADTVENLRNRRVSVARTLFDIDNAAAYRRYVLGLSARYAP
ncbi:MAG TPA: TIGR04282 family arsenosugar biosynthesis glycosyltransferase [Hyphomicrobiales bacterium]|nr:TIGR04282 family arsenosugar biosynthesis glycosyltransferase [Hyphomicrobiales bacterium]